MANTIAGSVQYFDWSGVCFQGLKTRSRNVHRDALAAQKVPHCFTIISSVIIRRQAPNLLGLPGRSTPAIVSTAVDLIVLLLSFGWCGGPEILGGYCVWWSRKCYSVCVGVGGEL